MKKLKLVKHYQMLSKKLLAASYLVLAGCVSTPKDSVSSTESPIPTPPSYCEQNSNTPICEELK